MTLDTWLHFGHVLSAIVWVGGGFLLSLLGSRARGSTDPNAVRDFAGMLAYLGPRVLAPATILTLIFGVALVLSDAEWNFAQTWVLLGLGLFAVAFLIGAVYLSRVSIQLGRATSAGVDDGGDAAGLLDRWILGYRAVLVVLVVIVWDMVFKPGM
jgi:uncharacterized membrane protein